MGILIPAQIAAAQCIVHASPRAAGRGAACLDAVSLLRFADDLYTLRSKLAMVSVVACYDAYVPGHDGRKGWAELGAYFAKFTHTALPDMSVFRANSTMETVNVMFRAGETFSSPVLVARDNWEAGVRTEAEWDRQIYLVSTQFMELIVESCVRLGSLRSSGSHCAGFAGWSLVAKLTPYTNLTTRPSVHRLPAAHIDACGIWKATFAGQALFHTHAAAGDLRESLTAGLTQIALYLVINVIWSCLGYRTANDNLFFPGRRDKQLARFVADRTGIMSFYNLPLLFLLAGRNDLLIWLTGWSYASCTLWHRWVARVATLQAIVHSVAYTWLEGERLAARWTEDPWRTGVVATIVMALMLPFAIRPLRERAYEAFLAVHIILSLVLLVLLFLHVRNFGTGYHAYLWACVGIWVFDRAARLTRVLFLTPTFKPNALALLPNPHGFVRLAIRTPRTLSPSPGSYFFLHLPSISPLANHPFTLASYRRTGAGGTELHFLCKPRGGSTSLLRASVERALANAIPHDLGALKLAVLLEGPYGVSHRLDRFDRVLLVAGGSGITALLPYIPLRECVSVVWMVQDAAQAEDVLVNELRQSAIGAALVDVWVTGSTTPSACLSRWPLGPPVPPPRAPSPEFPCPAAFSGYRCSYNSHMYRPTLSSPDAQHVLGGYTVVEKGRGECNGRVRVRWGRPCVTEILERHLHLEHSRLAILACGPDGMMDDMRAAVAAAYGRVGGDQMEYFEEAFSW